MYNHNLLVVTELSRATPRAKASVRNLSLSTSTCSGFNIGIAFGISSGFLSTLALASSSAAPVNKYFLPLMSMQ